MSTTQNHSVDANKMVVDNLMEQAQVFASSWSAFGGPFDSGNGRQNAEDARLELREAIEKALASAITEALRFRISGDAFDCGAEMYRQLVWGPLAQGLEAVTAQSPAGRLEIAREALVAGFVAGLVSHVVPAIGGPAVAELLQSTATAMPAVVNALRESQPTAH